MLFMKKQNIQIKENAIIYLDRMQQNEAFWKEFGYPSHDITQSNIDSDSIYEQFDEDLPFKEGRLFGRWSAQGW